MTQNSKAKDEIEEIVCVMPDYRIELIIRLLRVLSQATDRAVELSVKMAESISRKHKV